MPIRPSSGLLFRPSVSFILLVGLLAALWMAGGASRADALGQPVARAIAWGTLIVLAVAGRRPRVREAWPVLLFLSVAVLLAAAHCVPLPPAIWMALPGRDLVGTLAPIAGEPQPWRPLAIMPSGALNALGSLVVPCAVFALAMSLDRRERAFLPAVMIGLIAAATLIGLLQFSGAGFNNIFVNDKPGDVSGTFANRNHFALFLAAGCVLAPVWATLDGRRPGWRGPIAFGLVLLLALTILASGSRTGAAVGLVGICGGVLLAWPRIRRTIARYPRWVKVAVPLAIVLLLAGGVAMSIFLGRAVSITRAIEIDAAQDMRARALPTILEMVRTYFPAGSGLGGFDVMFRTHEPFGLLALTYNNHAHNDLVEIALDAGLPGILVLLGAAGWWAWQSARIWLGRDRDRRAVAKAGSIILALVAFASVFDYPARTPLIMALVVLAACWMCVRADDGGQSALPSSGKPL